MGSAQWRLGTEANQQALWGAGGDIDSIQTSEQLSEKPLRACACACVCVCVCRQWLYIQTNEQKSEKLGCRAFLTADSCLYRSGLLVTL